MIEIPNQHNRGCEVRLPRVTNEVRLSNYRPAPAPKPCRIPADTWARVARIADQRSIDPNRIVSALLQDFVQTYSASAEQGADNDFVTSEIVMRRSTAVQLDQLSYRMNKRPGDVISHLLATANRLPKRTSNESED